MHRRNATKYPATAKCRVLLRHLAQCDDKSRQCAGAPASVSKDEATDSKGGSGHIPGSSVDLARRRWRSATTHHEQSPQSIRDANGRSVNFWRDLRRAVLPRQVFPGADQTRPGYATRVHARQSGCVVFKPPKTRSRAPRSALRRRVADSSLERALGSGARDEPTAILTPSPTADTNHSGISTGVVRP